MLLVPTMEKDCPVRSSWIISTGAELPFESETVVLAVCPIGTTPKVTVLRDATRVPVFPALTTGIPPHPERGRRMPQNSIMNRATQQRLSRQIWARLSALRCFGRERLLQGDAKYFANTGSDGGRTVSTFIKSTPSPLRTFASAFASKPFQALTSFFGRLQ